MPEMKVEPVSLIRYLRAAQQIEPGVLTPYAIQAVNLAEGLIARKVAVPAGLHSTLVAIAFQVGEYLSPDTVTTWDHRGWRMVTTLPTGEEVTRCGRANGSSP